MQTPTPLSWAISTAMVEWIWAASGAAGSAERSCFSFSRPHEHCRQPPGRRSTLYYTPSSRYSISSSPFVLHTVSYLYSNDSHGNVSAMSYYLNGGLYSYPERELGVGLGMQSRTGGIPFRLWIPHRNLVPIRMPS